MNAVAKAMAMLQGDLPGSPEAAVKLAIEEIDGLEEIDSPAFQLEKVRSVNYLRETLKQVAASPGKESDKLKRELEAAVREENYERAAQLRDRLNSLG
ncbi:MAG: UvrB/UvrC motif-containing protein [Alkalispirochaetaceae bacterium]